MAGQTEGKELTVLDQGQDCGCGCAGTMCGAAEQEIVRTDSSVLAMVEESGSGRCECGCLCCA